MGFRVGAICRAPPTAVRAGGRSGGGVGGGEVVSGDAGGEEGFAAGDGAAIDLEAGGGGEVIPVEGNLSDAAGGGEGCGRAGECDRGSVDFRGEGAFACSVDGGDLV